MQVAFCAPQEQIRIWDKVKIAGKGGLGQNKCVGKDEKYTAINHPFLRCFIAESKDGKPTSAVVICGGGGYANIALQRDAIPAARLLNEVGISCFVLGYRLPDNREGALMDAQRAIRLIRKNAEKWNIDPNRVGIMGFSAGAHLSANVATNYNREVYKPRDKTDALSAKPDFTILVYPAYLADKETLALSEEIKVDKDTPPAFIVQNLDDTTYESSSLGYMLALRKAKVPVDLHYFAKGGHGNAFNYKDKPVAAWCELLKTWLKFNKLSE